MHSFKNPVLFCTPLFGASCFTSTFQLNALQNKKNLAQMSQSIICWLAVKMAWFVISTSLSHQPDAGGRKHLAISEATQNSSLQIFFWIFALFLKFTEHLNWTLGKLTLDKTLLYCLILQSKTQTLYYNERGGFISSDKGKQNLNSTAT